jgi:nuclear pore complex protein Nup85
LLCIYPEEQKMMQDSYQLTTVKAIWDFLEVFYVDKNAASWLPERLVDWLASYDGVLSSATLFSKLANLQQKLLNLRFPEDDEEYWDGIASALAVGWLDIVVCPLHIHTLALVVPYEYALT